MTDGNAINAIAGNSDQPPKASIFISYSRQDVAFADQLERGLRAHDFAPLIDRTEIYAFEDWWKRIQGLITKADTIIFVLSPDAVASDVCKKEVEFAASLNKRFAPVVYRPVESAAVPEPLRRLNFIFFDSDSRFDESMMRLAAALATDIEWVRKHTEFGEYARRWEGTGRPGPRGLLLRPPLLDEAEHWIASRPHDAPKSTQIFIAESRRAATQRRQVVTAALAAGLVVALGLAGLAYWQRQIAVEERGAAVEQRNKMLVSQSLFLASIAQQRLAEGDKSTAVLLAIEALPDAESASPRPYVPQAELALGRAWPEPVSFRAHVILAFGLAFSADGRRFVTASFDKTARLWNADSGQPIGEPLKGHTSALLHAEFSPDGRRIVTASLDGTARLWEADTGQPIRGPIEGHGLVYAAAFSPDGRRIITAGSDGTAQLWDADTGQSIGEPLKGHDDGILSVAFNHDGRRIVTASMDKTARLWDALTGRPILSRSKAMKLK